MIMTYILFWFHWQKIWHCYVICGEWLCKACGKWEFKVDQARRSRIVPVFDGISLSKMKEAIVQEFGVDGESLVTLSYWSPNSLKLATGVNTPPVMVTTVVGLDYFLKMAVNNETLNLCVTFDELRESLSGKIYGRSLVMDLSDELATAGTSISLDEEELVDEVLVVEAKRGSKRGPIVSEADCTYNSDGLEESGKESPIEEWDNKAEDGVRGDDYVMPAGYDNDFWNNFIDEDLGGTNAVDVMCSGEEALGFRLDGISDEETLPECSDPGGHVPVEQRELRDVDDEEFDIPPMFDDTEYERDPIPDLDRDDGDEVYKGKVYASKEDCQIGLAIYAIKNMFHYKQTMTKRESFVCNCSDQRCEWRILAVEKRESGYYEIRKAQLEHTCTTETRQKYMKKATAKVIAAVYKAKFGEPVKGPKPMDLQQLVLEELRVSSSYMKCWRARSKAIEEVHGNDLDAFSKLEEYLHLLKLANPGTITDIVTDIEENGKERFLYMFLAFGASITGFRKLRRVLVVDGTHLRGIYKGVLLTASGQDANFQVFPLAFAVVDSENDASWTWFFQKVERIIADCPTLTIISDRHLSIYTAKHRVFPKAHHGACIVHLERNVTSKFKNKGLGRMVRNAGCEFKVSAFNKIYKEIKAKNNECGTYLFNIGMAHWTRCYFQGERYNLMTSNIAETLNKALKEGRASPIVELLEFIRAMLTRWFSARRKKSQKHKGLVPPYVDKVMLKTMFRMEGSKIGSVTDWSYEIVGQFGEKHLVNLDAKKCNCKSYDKLQIPCGHAMMAANNLGVPYATLVGHCYKTATWAATYEGVVNPPIDESEVEMPLEIKDHLILSPRTRRPTGRPRELRIPSIGEFKVSVVYINLVNLCVWWAVWLCINIVGIVFGM